MKKMKEYFSEIADSLETKFNIEFQSLCKIGIIRVQSIKSVLDGNRILKKLNYGIIKGAAIQLQLI